MNRTTRVAATACFLASVVACSFTPRTITPQSATSVVTLATSTVVPIRAGTPSLTATFSPAFSLSATATQLAPRVPPTPTWNESRSKLTGLALTKEDIPYSSNPMFSRLIDPQVQPRDDSIDAVLLGFCNLDCVKRSWWIEQIRGNFVVWMHQTNMPADAKQYVTTSGERYITDFKYPGSFQNQGILTSPALPQFSWIAASSGLAKTVEDSIEFGTAWGSVVIMLRFQLPLGKVAKLPLAKYYQAIESLAVIQLGKLKGAGYTDY